MNYVEHENGILEWKTLYKTSSRGAEQQWDVSVLPNLVDGREEAAIRIEHGQVGGKIQVAIENVRQGKNLSKKNATTPLQQAIYQAESKFAKQLDKGYSTERGGAERPVAPMLAHKYEDNLKKVTFPCFVQPKLDGCRCIARKRNNKVELWSRQGKEFKGLQHIRETLSPIMKDGDIFDGELYRHGMSFQTLISLVKKDQEGSKLVEYHIYDTVDSELSFPERFDTLVRRFKTPNAICPIVCTHPAGSPEGVQILHKQYVEAGYEGVMVRVGLCEYKQGYRSRNLLKVKAWQDGEFEVIDVEPGVGKMEDQAILVCKTTEGVVFRAKPMGEDALRREYLANKQAYVGRFATIEYFEWTTSVPPAPRFPRAVKFKDELE